MGYLPKLVGFGLCLSLVLLLAGCEENAIPLDLDNTPMKLDTVSFPVNDLISYQSPPEMGKSDYLYFGEKNGYKHPYGLIKIDTYDQYDIVNISVFNDSLIEVDSLNLTLFSVTNTVTDLATFQLRYFPNGPDSLFNELSTHYNNFDPSIASDIITTARLQVDATDTVNTNYILNFSFGPDILDSFIDTSTTNHNRTFLIEPVNDLNDLFTFYSRENSVDKEPQITVFYRRFSGDSTIVDTLQLVFRTALDLTVTIPKKLSARDTTEIAIGQAKGLKTLAFVDFNSFELPPEAVIKTADLIFYTIEDTASKFTIVSYPIAIVGDYQNFKSYPEDPFDMNLNYFRSTARINNRFDIETRNFVADVSDGKTQNYGFKLYASSYNDPFQTVYLYGVDSDSLAPYLRIQYVEP